MNFLFFLENCHFLLTKSCAVASNKKEYCEARSQNKTKTEQEFEERLVEGIFHKNSIPRNQPTLNLFEKIEVDLWKAFD